MYSIAPIKYQRESVPEAGTEIVNTKDVSGKPVK